VSREHDSVNAFVDRLLANKRHRRCRATLEELEAMQVAIWLRAGRPSSDLPDPAFMDRLARRLRSEFGEVELDRNQTSRRAVLRTAAVAAGAVVVGVAADRLAQRAAAPIQTQPLVPDAGSRRPVAAYDALASGQAMRFPQTKSTASWSTRPGRSGRCLA
jgi:hypothetical protein